MGIGSMLGKGLKKTVAKTASTTMKKAATATTKKAVTRSAAKSNISKALGKKDAAIKQNNANAANNISQKTSQTSAKKDALNNAVNSGKDQIKQDAQASSEKTAKEANIAKSKAMTEQFKADSAALKNQFKLDTQKQKLDNKLAAQKAKQQNALQAAQNKHAAKLDVANQKVEMKKQAATNALQQKEFAKKAAADQKAALKQQKADNKLNAAQIKADNDAAWQKQKGSIQNENRTKFAEKTMEGLSFDQKMQYNRAQKREDKRNIKLANAGIDPTTGKLREPTIVGPGQTAVLPNGQTVGGFGSSAPPTGWQQAQNVMGGIANAAGNGLDRVMQIGMMSQMFGGMFGGTGGETTSEAPAGVPDTTTPQQPATGMTPAPGDQEAPSTTPSTTSPSHMVSGGININISANKNNHVWSGLQSGSSNSSGNTQAGDGTTSQEPNKKPSPSNTNDYKVPSQTGPNSSGWLV